MDYRKNVSYLIHNVFYCINNIDLLSTFIIQLYLNRYGMISFVIKKILTRGKIIQYSIFISGKMIPFF